MNGEARIRNLELEVTRLKERSRLEDESLRVARAEVNRRLDAMNELREQIVRERTEYVTTELYDQRHGEITRRIDNLEQWRANVIGRSVGLGLIGAVGIAVSASVLTHLIS